MFVSCGLPQIEMSILFKGYNNLERDTLPGMEETEAQKDITSDRHDGVQTAEAREHHYDASKNDRPSVTVDGVILSRRQRDLRVWRVNPRPRPLKGTWAV